MVSEHASIGEEHGVNTSVCPSVKSVRTLTLDGSEMSDLGFFFLSDRMP